MIKVVLCDDHAVVRRGIRDTLMEATDIRVVAEADGYASLREVFPRGSAWQPGYQILARLLTQGGGHLPDQASKTQQSDPGETGCRYADQELLPTMRQYGRFIDQEAFDSA